MMHAVDTNGRQYNKAGVYDQWWTDASIDQFDDKAEFIRQQFSQYRVMGILVSSISTII